MGSPALAALLGGAALFATPADAATVRLSASLSGAQVPEGGGDGDGFGSLELEISTESGYMCHRLLARNIKGAAAAAIHAGAAGESGPPVLPLDITGSGNDSCGKRDLALLTRIIGEPAAFYVDVRNRQFPNGAIRGQLQQR